MRHEDYWLTHKVALHVARHRAALRGRRVRVRMVRQGEPTLTYGLLQTPARWVIEPAREVAEPCS